MLRLLVGSALAAVLLSSLSALVLGTFWGITGNVCAPPGFDWGNCYEVLPKAGWPVAFWFDRGGVSVVGQLGAEDVFDLTLFAANTAVWSAITAVAAVLISMRLERGSR
ncbi:hypothetical protein [Parvularcula maris]|uniref:Uncharacterized protein n=1 Tax=Parvularcula maris TaxID=2965077 RepID=A0A9X2LA67_9PROT|nr:hypothetical protein [Parvularcula maris]MCQ8185995.1 hypothetical protein [Parvularcula maris]